MIFHFYTVQTWINCISFLDKIFLICKINIQKNLPRIKKKKSCSIIKRNFPSVYSGKELVHQCRRYQRLKFDPWVRKMTWSRK